LVAVTRRKFEGKTMLAIIREAKYDAR